MRVCDFRCACADLYQKKVLVLLRGLEGASLCDSHPRSALWFALEVAAWLRIGYMRLSRCVLIVTTPL